MDEDLVVDLRSLLSAVSAPPSITFDGETYEVDTGSYYLSFQVFEEIFQIRQIRCFPPGTGVGRLVLEAIHTYADERGLSVVANDVQYEAITFWYKMGYQEGSASGEFFRSQ